MRLIELYEDYDLPAEAIPYKSTNASGHLILSPYSNDIGFHSPFKNVDSLIPKIEQLIEQGKYVITRIPAHLGLATQYWLDSEQAGFGDPVFDELEDYPVVVKLSDNYFHIIDGHHRFDYAVSKKRPRVNSYVFDLS